MDHRYLNLQDEQGAQVGLSVEEHVGRPVSAGIRCWCIAFSSASSRSSMSETVLCKYDQQLDSLSTYAA